MSPSLPILLFALALGACSPGGSPLHPPKTDAERALPGEKKIVRSWGQRDDCADFWIYGDLEAGFAEARRTGKPLLINYRCVP